MKTVTLSLEFVKQAHEAACNDWKKRIEEHVPELRKPTIEVGKWYKLNLDGSLIFFDSIDDEENIVGYGLNGGVWDDCREKGTNWGSIRDEEDWTPATDQEVETALIEEIKRRYPLGSIIKWLDFENGKPSILGGYLFDYYENRMYGGGSRQEIFNNGKWAEIIYYPIQEEIEELKRRIEELKSKSK